MWIKRCGILIIRVSVAPVMVCLPHIDQRIFQRSRSGIEHLPAYENYFARCGLGMPFDEGQIEIFIRLLDDRVKRAFYLSRRRFYHLRDGEGWTQGCDSGGDAELSGQVASGKTASNIHDALPLPAITH